MNWKTRQSEIPEFEEFAKDLQCTTLPLLMHDQASPTGLAEMETAIARLRRYAPTIYIALANGFQLDMIRENIKLLERARKAEDTASRLQYPDTTGQ